MLKAEVLEATNISKREKSSTAKKIAKTHASFSPADNSAADGQESGKRSSTAKRPLKKGATPQETTRGQSAAREPVQSASQPRVAGASQSEDEYLCSICEKAHKLQDCARWKSMTVNARWHAARAFNTCFRCLSSAHRGRACTNHRQCGVEGCVQTHHPDLHYVPKTTEPASARDSSPHSASVTNTCYSVFYH